MKKGGLVLKYYFVYISVMLALLPGEEAKTKHLKSLNAKSFDCILDSLPFIETPFSWHLK